MEILVPHALARKAETAGVRLTSTAKVGALKQITAEVRKLGGDQPAERPPVRSPEAADARMLLGLEIQARRKELRLSRRLLHAGLVPIIDATPGEIRERGWGVSSVQAWETGQVTPRQIEPIIQVLKPGPSAEVNWRRWWALSRVGLTDEERQRALGDQALAGVAEGGELSAVDRLKLTLAENS